MRQSCVFVSLIMAGAVVSAAAAPPVPAAAMQRELIYCADQMTPEEREAYRVKMRGAQSVTEQEKIRAEHQLAMQARVASLGGAAQCTAVGRQYRQGVKP